MRKRPILNTSALTFITFMIIGSCCTFVWYNVALYTN